MTQSTNTEILVPTDFSEMGDAAAQTACALAGRLRLGVRLMHAHVGPGFNLRDAAWMLSPDELEAIAENSRTTLYARAMRLRESHPELAITTSLIAAEPVEGIATVALEHSPRLVVMGTHGHGFWSRALLGSVALETLRALPFPVLSVQAPSDAYRSLDSTSLAQGRHKMLVLMDTDPLSEQVLDTALELATPLEWSVEVLHVVRGIEGLGEHTRETWIAAASRAIERVVAPRRSSSEALSSTIAFGVPVREALERAKDPAIRLVLMGTHGRGRIASLLAGAIADDIVRLAPCPVVTCTEAAVARRS